MLKPAIQLNDPNNLESELKPTDYANRVPRVVTDEEQTLVKLTKEMFDASATARQPFEEMAGMSLAFYLGNHGVTWNATTRSLNRIRPRSPHRVQQSRNKIRPKIKKGLATALRNDPDITIAPWTAANTDRAAAMMGRAVDTHFRIAHKKKQALWRAARWAWTTSTFRRKYWWNPDGWAEVPTGVDEDGNPNGSSLQQVGTIETCDVPWFECYPDPDARAESEIRWIIHACEMSLEAIQQKYEDGWMVGGGGPEGLRSATEVRIASIVGGYPKGTSPQRGGRTQTVYEAWELPTPAYKQGRWWTCSGDGRVLTEPTPLPSWLQNPDDGKWELPFNALSYETPMGTVHGLNAVFDNIGAQKDYNNSVSRLAELLRTAWGKVLACTGAEITSTAFDSARPDEVVYWKPNAGGAPIHLPAPQLPDFVMQNIELADHDMQDMTGVHEVSEGNAPPQVTAASALKILTDNDNTQIADFTQELEAFVEKDAKFYLRMARAYFREPRLLFLAQTKGSKTNAVPTPRVPSVSGAGHSVPGMAAMGAAGGDSVGVAGGASAQAGPTPPTVTPQDLPSPVMQMQMFDSFAAGSLRVMVTPGSATPKSPEAEAELILELIKLGLFELPPPIAKVILEELEIMDPNTVFESMLQAQADALAIAQQQQAMQPDPADAAIKQATVQAQIQQILEAVKVHGQVTVIQAKAQAEAEAKAMALHGLEHMEYVKAFLASKFPKAPTTAISVKAHGDGTAGAEMLAQFPRIDDPAKVAAAMAPKPAASTNGAKSNAASSQK